VTARKVFTQKRCTVCNSPDRVLIEASHVAGASLDSIALRFKGVSRDAIWRHMAKHVSDSDRAHYLAAIPHEQLAEAAAAEGISVLQYFSIIRATLMSQFQLANSINDRVGVSALAGRLNEILRSIGSISGEMGSMAANSISITNNVNILNSPVYASLQANLLTALAPYPDARAAVVQALRQIDQRNTPLPELEVIEDIPVAEFATKKVALDVPSTQSISG
jgi:hypothetical protein